MREHHTDNTIEWINTKTGKIQYAHVFIGVLGFSQFTFAWASEDEHAPNWLLAHRKMYDAFGGVPKTTICDCLYHGSIKSLRHNFKPTHGYAEIAAHYQTEVITTEPSQQKNKSRFDSAVKRVMRAFYFIHRRHSFTSIAEINHALAHVVDQINRKPHRHKVSRLENWASHEKHALQALPTIAFEAVEWKTATVHPDCTISLEGAYYSAPHQHRGKEARIKLSATHVEIFIDHVSVALHNRDLQRKGHRHSISGHRPPNPYQEETPQNLLTEAHLIMEPLGRVVEELLKKDTLGNLRRVQFMIRTSQAEIKDFGRDVAELRILEVIEQMYRLNNFRIRYFLATLQQLRQKSKGISQTKKMNAQREKIQQVIALESEISELAQ